MREPAFTCTIRKSTTDDLFVGRCTAWDIGVRRVSREDVRRGLIQAIRIALTPRTAKDPSELFIPVDEIVRHTAKDENERAPSSSNVPPPLADEGGAKAGDTFVMPKIPRLRPEATLRDEFAGQVLIGQITRNGAGTESFDKRVLAEWCYRMADEMMTARGR